MEETNAPQIAAELPRVSVIVVARNQATALRQCLEALHRSTWIDAIEILVVDNGSQDGSNVIQDDFEKITYLKLPKNFGWTKAANIALRSSRAETILFVDPRVSLEPTAIETLAGQVTASSDAAAVCPLLLDASGQPARVLRTLPIRSEMRPEPFSLPEAPAEPTPVEFPGLYALLIRKAFLKGMSFFDERYGELWADAEVAAQVKRAGRKILLLPEARGIFDDAGAPPPLPQSLLDADFEQGAATYLTKHFGGGTGRRMSAALGALVSFRFGLLSNLLGGQKIDGTQE